MEQDVFRVRVFSPVGIRDVTANGIGTIKETYTRKDSTRFEMERTLEGNVTFLCEDFDYFYDFSRSDRRYDEVKAVISILCGTVWVEKWRAFVEVRKGTFDLERKSFECSFSLETTNRDFDSRKSDAFNLLELVAARKTTTPQYIAGITYTNGVPLYPALLAMLREVFAVTSIKSDFFSWNPDDPSYVIGHSDLLHDQALFHKSDIVKASSPGYSAATILNVTLEDFINNLCNLYNLRYTLDAAGNFRIEHVSWYSRGTDLDLTQSKYEKTLRGTHKFSYDEPKIFKQEKFTNEGSVNGDFVGVPIRYDNDFIKELKESVGNFETDKEDEDTLERKVNWFTDIDAIYGNINNSVSTEPNRDQDLEGVVLLALDGSGNIEKVNGIIETFPTQRNNNVNAWGILHDDYWKDDRLFPEGYMNDVLTTFTSVQRIKKRATVTIPFCCDETIDVEAEVITEYGNAVIEKITFDPYRGTAEIELAYEDLDSLSLSAPTAVDDIYATDISTTLDTVLASKPSLLANDTGATTAYVESKSTLLGGTVSIASDGHFVYVPPTGATGADLFDYIALNAGGRLDIANAKIIIKVGTVYVHMANEDSTLALYPPGSGTLYIYKRVIYFYEDPLLQVPLDLTAYGVTIFYSGTNNAVPFSGSFLASGFSHAVFSNAYSAAHTVTATITPDAAYTIV